MILWRQTVNQLWSARTLPHLLPGYAKMTCSPAKEGTLVSQTFSGSCPFICLNFPAFLQWSCESHIPTETLYTPLNAFNGPCLATITHLTTHRTTPSIHPSSSAYPGLGCRGSCLSKDTQTSLSPDTSSSSPGRVPRHSQASWVTARHSSVSLLCVLGLPWGLLPVGYARNPSWGSIQEVSDTDDRATSAGSSWCGGAAALLWAPPRWQSSSTCPISKGAPCHLAGILYFRWP